uniref:Uncharacterized protein n=1 Tax=Rhizophora mucronata TaxID=61149 RepID=A0A2P2NJY1_RHIMU
MLNDLCLLSYLLLFIAWLCLMVCMLGCCYFSIQLMAILLLCTL